MLIKLANISETDIKRIETTNVMKIKITEILKICNYFSVFLSDIFKENAIF
jgi:DNA-binding Xre family transcriptional regulator